MRYSRAYVSIKISPYETSFISSISFWKKQHHSKNVRLYLGLHGFIGIANS